MKIHYESGNGSCLKVTFVDVVGLNLESRACIGDTKIYPKYRPCQKAIP